MSNSKEKKFNLKAKGEPGYIQSKKRMELLMAIGIFAIAVAIFVLGLALNKWEKGNIFTVVACLFIIPMARFATTFVMFLPFKSVTKEQAAIVEKQAKPGSIIYADAILASEKNAMLLAFMVITGDKIIGVTGREKEDVFDIRNYLQDIVTRRGYDYKVTITDDFTKFCSLLKASDSVLDINFDDEEDKEAFELERKKLCDDIEALMP